MIEGMTDKQFAVHINLVIREMKRAIDSKTKEESDKILKETIEDLKNVSEN